MYRTLRLELKLLSVLCALLLLGCSRTSFAAVPLDRSTPDSVILALYDAISRQDVALFGAVCALDPDTRETAEQAMGIAIETGIRYEIRDIEWDVISKDSETLRVDTRYRETITMNGKVLQEIDSGDWLTLIQKDGEWYVLCPQP